MVAVFCFHDDGNPVLDSLSGRVFLFDTGLKADDWRLSVLIEAGEIEYDVNEPSPYAIEFTDDEKGVYTERYATSAEALSAWEVNAFISQFFHVYDVEDHRAVSPDPVIFRLKDQ